MKLQCWRCVVRINVRKHWHLVTNIFEPPRWKNCKNYDGVWTGHLPHDTEHSYKKSDCVVSKMVNTN